MFVRLSVYFITQEIMVYKIDRRDGRVVKKERDQFKARERQQNDVNFFRSKSFFDENLLATF